MIFIPTWIDMILLIVSYGWLVVQLWQMRQRGLGSRDRVAVMAVLVAVMVATVFANRTDPWRSLGFFVVALLGLGTTAFLQRKVPAWLPRGPRM